MIADQKKPKIDLI